MKVFSCVNHAPDELAKFLCSTLGYSPTDLNFVQESVNKKRVQIFLDYKQFTRMHRTLPKKSEMIVVVFGNPFQFYSWNIIPLDYRESDEPHLNAFEYIPFDSKTLRLEQEPLAYKNRNYLNKIVETVSAFDNLLRGLMSFIYTMKTPEQKTAKEAACRFLYRGHGHDILRRDLSSLNDRQTEKMIGILSADVAHRIQKAFSDNTLSIDECAKKYDVSAFELRFIEHNAKLVR